MYFWFSTWRLVHILSECGVESQYDENDDAKTKCLCKYFGKFRFPGFISGVAGALDEIMICFVSENEIVSASGMSRSRMGHPMNAGPTSPLAGPVLSPPSGIKGRLNPDQIGEVPTERCGRVWSACIRHQPGSIHNGSPRRPARHQPCNRSILGHRLRRWPRIVPLQDQRLGFVGSFWKPCCLLQNAINMVWPQFLDMSRVFEICWRLYVSVIIVL